MHRLGLLLFALALACLASRASATGTAVTFGAKPSPAQNAVIQRAAAADVAEARSSGHALDYILATADLNDDGRPDLLAHYQVMDFCGSAGCSGVAVLATPSGYAPHAIGLPNFQETLTVLPSKHHGFHDLRFDEATHIFQWNGKSYR